ncbi:MAG TPA: WbqC family protein [Aurantimonas sp.]
MKRVAIVQSNYIPWKGYFDLIAAVDEFVLYDDVQFTQQDWRNRNLIKTPKGTRWLTVPVPKKSRIQRTIRDTPIQSGTDWCRDHWASLQGNYRQAECFAEIAEIIEPLYRCPYADLSTVNETFIRAICEFLGIGTKLSSSSDYRLDGDRTERLVGICTQTKADVYVSGPAAKDYLDEVSFAAEGIGVEWYDYSCYPSYPQMWGEFVHGVSVLDLLFNCGKEAPRYMKLAD